MTLFSHAPAWLLFAALAIPLASVAWTSRRTARDIAANADYSPKMVSEGPVTYNDDGTRTQTFTIRVLESISGRFTISFGPVSISANAREWAANAVLLGLLLVLVGLVGLLHFPTNSSVSTQQQLIDYIDRESTDGG
jgi:hypothetical protein